MSKTAPAEAVGSGELALVTGGNGYLAGWTIVALLEAGYRVRATLRSLALEAQVRAAIARHVQAGDRLSFVAADLGADEGWDEAVHGARYVLHMASPMPRENQPQQGPSAARGGVARILSAADRAGVTRVVMTSSLQAARPRRGADRLLQGDERVWTRPGFGLDPYIRDKTLAEKEVWGLMAARPNDALSLTTILPGLVLGPALGDGYGGSLELVARLLRGEVSGLANLGFNIVDVRDLAALHLRAMTAPQAAGQRFIATGGFLWLQYIASLLRQAFPGHAEQLSVRNVSALEMYWAALLDPRLRPLLGELGRQPLHGSSKALALLDWRARPASQAVIACGQSLVERGLV
jgi:nucleoside-diphosphate-sugar epimerase